MKKKNKMSEMLKMFLLGAFVAGCSENMVGPDLETYGDLEDDGLENALLLEDNGDHEILGGDIVLQKDDEDHAELLAALKQDPEKLAKGEGLREAWAQSWPNGRVPYRLVGFSSSETQVILSAMADIEAASGVDFYPSTASTYVYTIRRVRGKNWGGRSTLGYSRYAFCELNQV